MAARPGRMVGSVAAGVGPPGSAVGRCEPGHPDSLVRSAGDQLGFININTSRSADPELERRIVTDVASYGRQLGRILDAVAVLVGREQRGKLSADERRALDELEALHADVQTAKARFTAGHVDRLVAEIRALAQDATANADALQRVRDALADS